MVVGYITTVKERCRMCYTCVRECPAKAIRVATGQAEVIGERCIACGNCVRVCSQEAKQVRGTNAEVRTLLASDLPVAACLAPSFPAAFAETDYPRVVGMLRALGFDLVLEVSFGADLVAREYRKLLDQIRAGRNDLHFIEVMTCPGGCINGGGQPIALNTTAVRSRMQALYSIDQNAPVRVSYQNQSVKRLYDEYLGQPLGEKSHHLLHTHYEKREIEA